MESVGQKLRAARLGLGLTLEDVSAKTRINLRSLSALETDAFDVISSRFLYRSFVRQVADVVGLSSDALHGDLDAATMHIPEALVPGQAGAPAPPRLPSLRTSRVRLSRWISSVALLIVMLAACSSLYAVWQRSRNGLLEASISALHRSADASRKAAHTPAGVASSISAAASAPANLAPVRVEVSALERTWVSANADGKDVYTGVLQAAERKTLESREIARVRTGDAGAVQIIFNGKNLGALGSRGQVETVEFQKNGYHVVQSSDQHLALATLGVASAGSFRR